MHNGLADPVGRRFNYLRLSLTEACNFRCEYCLPDGYRGVNHGFLDIAEIRRLIRAFAEMGIRKLRLTGGEPLLRRDLVQIVADAAAVPGIETIALTTNGYRLAPVAHQLREAGLDAVNISLDSLDPRKFEQITGDSRHAAVMHAVEASLDADFSSVKINTVLLRGRNLDEVPAFLEFARRRPVTVRFIELMQTAGNTGYFAERHVPSTEIAQQLIADGWMPAERTATGGPAVEYEHAHYTGRIGLIAPYATGFCDSCNRLRVTARGRLRLCLFGSGNVDLRPYLSDDISRVALQELVSGALLRKPPAHRLQSGDCGDIRHLASTGG